MEPNIAFEYRIRKSKQWFSHAGFELGLGRFRRPDAIGKAQDGKRSEDGAPNLGSSEVAFDLQYSC